MDIHVDLCRWTIRSERSHANDDDDDDDFRRGTTARPVLFYIFVICIAADNIHLTHQLTADISLPFLSNTFTHNQRKLQRGTYTWYLCCDAVIFFVQLAYHWLLVFPLSAAGGSMNNILGGGGMMPGANSMLGGRPLASAGSMGLPNMFSGPGVGGATQQLSGTPMDLLSGGSNPMR